MAESVILSAIESLDNWLLKKSDLFEENYGKVHSLFVDKADLCSPLVEMADLREDIKEKLYNLLVGKADFGEDNKEKLYNFLVGISDFREDNMEKLHKLMIGMVDFSQDKETELSNLPRCFLKEYKENIYSLLVGMVDFRGENKEKMKSLLVGMADFWEDNKEKLYRLLVWVAVLADSGLYKNKQIVYNKNVYSLLVEMTDLWGDNENGKLNKDKLHTLLFEITDLRVDEYTRKRDNEKLYQEKVYSLMADIKGLWKSVMGKLDKVKVYSWLAKKADLWEHNQLFRLLLDVAFHHENKDADKFIRNMVEGIKGELRSILGFLRDKKLEEGSSLSLHYFVSDAVEMAHDAQVLIDVRDTDPFIIFLIFNSEDRGFIDQDCHRFVNKICAIKNWIQETKECMLRFGVDRAITKSQIVEGGEGVVVGLEEDIKLLLRIKNTHTIFIRGMAGIGKTTLARILYNHAAVVDKFECRAWVCFSWESSRKEILMKLIRQVVDSKEFERDAGYLEKMDNKGLKQMLHQHLQGM